MKYKNMHLAITITGIRLKEIREERQIGVATLGKYIGKHHKTIIDIENGFTDPSIALLAQLIEGLGIEFTDFFDERYNELFYEITRKEQHEQNII